MALVFKPFYWLSVIQASVSSPLSSLFDRSLKKMGRNGSPSTFLPYWMFTDAHIWIVLLIFVFFTQASRQKKKEIKKWKLKLNLVGLKLQNLNGPQQLFLIFPTPLCMQNICTIVSFPSTGRFPFFPIWRQPLVVQHKHWKKASCTNCICRMQTQGERIMLLKEVLTWNPQQYFIRAEILSIKTQVLSAALTCSQWTFQEENWCWWPSSSVQFSQAQWTTSIVGLGW